MRTRKNKSRSESDAPQTIFAEDVSEHKIVTEDPTGASRSIGQVLDALLIKISAQGKFV